MEVVCVSCNSAENGLSNYIYVKDLTRYLKRRWMRNDAELDVRTVIACEFIGRAVVAIRANNSIVNDQSIRQWLVRQQENIGRDDIRQQLFTHAIALLSDELGSCEKRSQG